MHQYFFFYFLLSFSFFMVAEITLALHEDPQMNFAYL